MNGRTVRMDQPVPAGETDSGRKGRQTRRTGAVSLLLLFVLLVSLLLCGYSNLDEKVFDDADLLTDEEEEKLQEAIVSMAQETSFDIIVVTASDTGGKTSQQYADDFYDDHEFGYEQDNGSGILFLIDMYNREYYISTAGEAISAFTDADIEDMLDDIWPDMRDGDYYEACMTFVEGVGTYGVNADTAQNGYYDAEQNEFLEYSEKTLRARRRAEQVKAAFTGGKIVTRLIISLAFGGVLVFAMTRTARKERRPGSQVYMRPGSERIRGRQDRFIHTTVITHRIPRANGGPGGPGGRPGGPGGSFGGGGFSSSHMGGGGMSHGGGGRGF